MHVESGFVLIFALLSNALAVQAGCCCCRCPSSVSPFFHKPFNFFNFDHNDAFMLPKPQIFLPKIENHHPMLISHAEGGGGGAATNKAPPAGHHEVLGNMMMQSKGNDKGMAVLLNKPYEVKEKPESPMPTMPNMPEMQPIQLKKNESDGEKKTEMNEPEVAGMPSDQGGNYVMFEQKFSPDDGQPKEQQKEHHDEDHHHDKNIHYKFEYAVHDEKTRDIKSQKEERKGDVVRGEYSLLEDDGNVRTVKYYADWKNGFHADVLNSKKKP